MKKIVFIFIFIINMSGDLVGQTVKNPFISIIEKKSYEQYQNLRKNQKLDIERAKREKEKKSLELELKQKKRREEYAFQRELLKKEKKRRVEVHSNPYVPIEQKANDGLQKEVGMPDFSIQGIMIFKSGPRVIINDEIYSEGDIINNAITIIKIKENEVEFLYNKEIFLRNIPPGGGISIIYKSENEIE